MGPRPAAPRRRARVDHHRRHRRRPPRPAPLDRARHGPGGHPALPRGQVLDRPGHRRRLLLRLRPAGREDLLRRRPGRHRGPHGRDRRRRPALRPRRAGAEGRAGAVRRPAVQAGDHRAGPGGRRRRRRRRRGRRRHRHQRLPQHPGVRRPVPGPARPEHRAPRPVQADEGGRRVLAREREGPDAPAHLRHGVGEPGRAGGAPPPPGGGREARPPPPRRGAGPRLVPVRARRRAGRVAPQGRGDPQADGGLQPGPPRGRRVRVRVHPAPGQGRPLPDLRPPRLVQGRRCTRPWSWTTGPTTRSR